MSHSDKLNPKNIFLHFLCIVALAVFVHQPAADSTAPETRANRYNGKMWQQINADLIRKQNLGSRLYPHRVNTLGKMQEITDRGIRSFETDVFFRPEGGFFEVGHHEGAMTGMTLESFLEKIPRAFEKIWLDVKDVTDATVSFDLRLYKFVKDYLEAGLGSQVVYHTWYPGVTFESTNLLEEMQEREYFHDSRVKTILLPYASEFSL